MDGLNIKFAANPMIFLSMYVVDNAEWEKGLAAPGKLKNLGTAKEGDFDFSLMKSLVNTVRFDLGAGTASEPGIRAYYCPFVAGDEAPGWVDVPRRDPAHRFVFTAAMHGCALYATAAPSAADFRVHHHHHPEQLAHYDSKMNVPTTQAISSLAYNEYATDDKKAGGSMTNAFNCLWYDTKIGWVYLSQSNLFVPHATSFTMKRDTTRPILTKKVL